MFIFTKSVTNLSIAINLAIFLLLPNPFPTKSFNSPCLFYEYYINIYILYLYYSNI